MANVVATALITITSELGVYLVLLSPPICIIPCNYDYSDPLFLDFEFLLSTSSDNGSIQCYINPSEVNTITDSFAFDRASSTLTITKLNQNTEVLRFDFSFNVYDYEDLLLGIVKLILIKSPAAKDGYTAVLSNESESITTDSQGNVILWIDIPCSTSVIYGTSVELQHSFSQTPPKGYYNVLLNPFNCTVSQVSSDGSFLVTGVTPGIVTSRVDVVFNIENNVTITKTMSLNKSLGGTPAVGQFTPMLETDNSYVACNEDGTPIQTVELWNYVECYIDNEIVSFLDVKYPDDGKWGFWSVQGNGCSVLLIGQNLKVTSITSDLAYVSLDITYGGNSYYKTWNISKQKQGKTGPSLTYYGEYNDDVKLPYTVLEGQRIIVKYTRSASDIIYKWTPPGFVGVIPTTATITDTRYWLNFDLQYNSIATGVLFAENAYIDVLESNGIYVGGKLNGGWVITGENGGEIYHTETGLKLTSDGKLISPSGGIVFSNGSTNESLEDYVDKTAIEEAKKQIEIGSYKNRNLIRFSSKYPSLNYWYSEGVYGAYKYVDYDQTEQGLMFATKRSSQYYIANLTMPIYSTNYSLSVKVSFYYKHDGVFTTNPSLYVIRSINDSSSLVVLSVTNEWLLYQGEISLYGDRIGFRTTTSQSSVDGNILIKSFLVTAPENNYNYSLSPEDLIVGEGRNYALKANGVVANKTNSTTLEDFYFRTSDDLLNNITPGGDIVISADFDLIDSGTGLRQCYVLVSFKYTNSSGVEIQHDCTLSVNQLSIKKRVYGAFKLPDNIKFTGYKFRLVSMRPGYSGTVSNIKVEIGINQTRYDLPPEESDFLTEAFKGSTTINGGAILSNVLLLFPIGVDTANTNNVTAGMSGGSSTTSPAIWAGGTYEQAVSRQSKFGVDHRGNAWFDGSIKSLSGQFGCFNAALEDVYVRDSDGNDAIIISSLPLSDVIPSNQTLTPSITGNGVDYVYNSNSYAEYGEIDLLVFRLNGSFIGNYRFEAKVSLYLALAINVSGTNPPGAQAKGGIELYYKIFKTSGNVLQYDSRSDSRMYIERNEIQFSNFTWSDSKAFDINKSFFFLDSYVIFYASYGALFNCYGTSDGEVEVYASLTNVKLVSTSKKCIHSPDGFHYQFDGSKHFLVNVTNSSTYLNMIAAGLPTSTSGLVRNQLYRDSSNYIRINNPTTLDVLLLIEPDDQSSGVDLYAENVKLKLLVEQLSSSILDILQSILQMAIKDNELQNKVDRIESNIGIE